MNYEIPLIKFFTVKENYEEHFNSYPKKFLSAETLEILKYFGGYYQEVDQDVDPKFDAWLFLINSPGMDLDKKSYIQGVLSAVYEYQLTVEIEEKILNKLAERKLASELVTICQDILEGKDTSIEEVVKYLEKHHGKVEDTSVKSLLNKYSYANTLEELAAIVENEGMYNWRLNILNNTLGKARQQMLVSIGAKPDTGKTSFLFSETLYLLSQMPKTKKLIFFQNEESAIRTQERLYHILRYDYPGIKDASHRYRILHKPDWSYWEIDNILKHIKDEIGIIVFNTLDKVKGFGENNFVADHHSLKAAYEWARTVTIRYNAPVFTASQISETSGTQRENKKVLYFTDLAGAKTGKAENTDVCIQIARTLSHSDEGFRFITIDKNKLLPRNLWGERVKFIREAGVFVDAG